MGELHGAERAVLPEVSLAPGRWLAAITTFVRWSEDWLARTVEALDGERFHYPRL